MAEHNDFGKQGEEEAMHYLQANGYQVLERNYRYQHAEIDLIAQKGKMIIFVEVKARSSTAFGNPEEFVSYTKVRLLKKAAEHYIFAKDWQHDVRFDIVAIVRTGGEMKVKHIEDAFY
ncbi:MAG: YraN family protein [Rudanella sp.]|nr:YraN family protein [Rudanella sp.]